MTQHSHTVASTSVSEDLRRRGKRELEGREDMSPHSLTMVGTKIHGAPHGQAVV